MLPATDITAAITKMVDDILAASNTYDINYRLPAGSMSGQFLAAFVAGALDKAVRPTAPGMSKAEQHAFAVKRYREIKTIVQDAVASGFDAAMAAYASPPIHYYCQIKPTPEGVSKQPC